MADPAAAGFSCPNRRWSAAFAVAAMLVTALNSTKGLTSDSSGSVPRTRTGIIDSVADSILDSHGAFQRSVRTDDPADFDAIVPFEMAWEEQGKGDGEDSPADTRAAGEKQRDPPWGLDRIDQKEQALNGLYTYTATGKNVDVYVLDSGIHMSHQEFGGRAINFVDLIGGNGWDTDGHGTHVAAIIGGLKYGVAKRVRLLSVRVMSGFGELSAEHLIKGLDTVTAAVLRNKRPSVINISLSNFGKHPQINQAVQRALDVGITVVVAAGNAKKGSQPKDACTQSPGLEPGAITVAATDSTDGFSPDSHYGKCVDILAPGREIVSAATTSVNARIEESGTSQAAPHVTGAVALFLERNPTASPSAVAKWLADNAVQNSIHTLKVGTPNRLLFIP